jgi:hypothetical protein
MKEKIDKAKCYIHGSNPCEVFIEIHRSQIERYNKKRRQVSKDIIDEQLQEYYEDREAA